MLSAARCILPLEGSAPFRARHNKFNSRQFFPSTQSPRDAGATPPLAALIALRALFFESLLSPQFFLGSFHDLQQGASRGFDELTFGAIIISSENSPAPHQPALTRFSSKFTSPQLTTIPPCGLSSIGKEGPVGQPSGEPF